MVEVFIEIEYDELTILQAFAGFARHTDFALWRNL